MQPTSVITAITGTVIAVVAVVGITATATEYVRERERDLNTRIASVESKVLAIDAKVLAVESELRIVKAGVDRNTELLEAIKRYVSESRDAHAEGDASRE